MKDSKLPCKGQSCLTFTNIHENVYLQVTFQTDKSLVEHRQKVSINKLKDIKLLAKEVQQRKTQRTLQSSKQSSQSSKEDDLCKVNILALQINLQLQNNQLYSDSTKIIKIISEADLPELKSFSIKNAQLSERGVLILATQTYWPKLQSLDLFYCGLNENCLKVINKARWKITQSLNLNSNQISDLGVYYISQSIVINPKNIYLQRCLIECGGIKTLLKGRNKLENLQDINLNQNLISDQGFQALTLMNWPKLRKISLDYNHITEKGMQNIRKVNWPQLQFFSIVNNCINAYALQHLGFAHFPEMSSFNLSFNRIGNKIFEFLVKSNMKNLQHLILTNMKISTCPDFRAADMFLELTYVNLSGNYIPQIKLNNFVRLSDNNGQEFDDYENNQDNNDDSDSDEDSNGNENLHQDEVQIQY